MAIEPGVDQEAIVAQVADEWTTWKGARSELEREWYEIHRGFRSKHPTTRKIVQGRSNRYSPLAHKGTMNLHSQIMPSLLPPDFFQIVPEDVDDEVYADAVATELTYLIRLMRFYREASVAVLQAIIYGTSPWSLGWNTRYSMVTTGYLGASPIRRRRLLYDGPRLITRDIFNVLWDMESHEPEDIVPRMSRTWRPFHYLEQMAQPGQGGYQVYENLEDLRDIRSYPEYGDDWRSERLETVGITDGNFDPDRASGRVEIIERWGDFPVEIDNEVTVFQNYIAVIGNRQTLLRFEPNPVHTGTIPLQQFTYQPGDQPSEIIGIGALGPGRGLGDLANGVLNGFMDLLAKMIRGQHKYLKTDRFFEPDKWEDGTNALIGVGNMENLVPIINDISLFNVVQIYGLLKQEYQEAIGSTENLTSIKAPVTATEFSGAASIASGRNRQIVRNMEEGFTEPFLRMLIDFRRQYGPDAEVQRRVANPNKPNKSDWKKIPPEAFAAEFSIRCTGSGYIAMKEERLQRYMMFLQVIGQLDPTTVQDVNLPYIVRKVWSEFGFRDDDKVFKGDDPIEQLLKDIGGSGPGMGGGNGRAASSGRGALAPTR